jgi:hypothetical protein
VLVRLDKELAPFRASVNREGDLLQLSGPEDRPDPQARVMDVVHQMGYFAAAIEEHPEVARWFGADDTDELSREEARVLAGRWVAELAEQKVIDAPDRLAEPLRSALVESFGVAARTGAVETIRLGRHAFAQVLSQTETDRVLEWIESKLLPHDSN